MKPNFQPGEIVTINRSIDLFMLREARPFIGKECFVDHVTKAGLVEVRLSANPWKRMSFAAYNVSRGRPDQQPKHTTPLKLEGIWTIEKGKDIIAYHGLDVEEELLKVLMAEVKG